MARQGSDLTNGDLYILCTTQGCAGKGLPHVCSWSEIVIWGLLVNTIRTNSYCLWRSIPTTLMGILIQVSSGVSETKPAELLRAGNKEEKEKRHAPPVSVLYKNPLPCLRLRVLLRRTFSCPLALLGMLLWRGFLLLQVVESVFLPG